MTKKKLEAQLTRAGRSVLIASGTWELSSKLYEFIRNYPAVQKLSAVVLTIFVLYYVYRALRRVWTKNARRVTLDRVLRVVDGVATPVGIFVAVLSGLFWSVGAGVAASERIAPSNETDIFRPTLRAYYQDQEHLFAAQRLDQAFAYRDPICGDEEEHERQSLESDILIPPYRKFGLYLTQARCAKGRGDYLAEAYFSNLAEKYAITKLGLGIGGFETALFTLKDARAAMIAYAADAMMIPASVERVSRTSRSSSIFYAMSTKAIQLKRFTDNIHYCGATPVFGPCRVRK